MIILGLVAGLPAAIAEKLSAAITAYLKMQIAAGVDAVLVQDVGIARLVRGLSPDFPMHASTQMTITSAAGVEFARELGCHRAILARLALGETTVSELAKPFKMSGPGVSKHLKVLEEESDTTISAQLTLFSDGIVGSCCDDKRDNHES